MGHFELWLWLRLRLRLGVGLGLRCRRGNLPYSCPNQHVIDPALEIVRLGGEQRRLGRKEWQGVDVAEAVRNSNGAETRRDVGQ